MALRGEGAGGRRTELAMFAPALLAPVGLADELSRYWEFADVAGKRFLAVAGTRKARRS